MNLPLIGGFIGVAVLLYYAFTVATGKSPAGSIATWASWTVLDVLLTVITAKAGNPIWLPLGWTIGAGTVAATLLAKGTWTWTYRETITTIGAAIAAGFWLTQEGLACVVAGTTAMTVAGIPLYRDMIRTPIPQTFYLWAGTAVACVLTVFGSEWTWIGLFLPVSSFLFNGSLALVVLRKPKTELP